MIDPPVIYVGFDSREALAYSVCAESIRRRSSRDPLIRPLVLNELQGDGGIYTRKFIRRADGQRIDTRDRKPFSTEFSFTRFLVPQLALHRGWALFCDCDFLFTADIVGVFELADPQYAVMCVKHEHVPVETVKMGGQEQTIYPRKNWSSLMLWNCGHAKNRGALTLDCVNKQPGRWLHGFGWLKDDDIGDLPRTWNHLVDVDPTPNELPCGIHYTLGVPTMPGYENCTYADLWRAELDARTRLRPTITEFARARNLFVAEEARA